MSRRKRVAAAAKTPAFAAARMRSRMAARANREKVLVVSAAALWTRTQVLPILASGRGISPASRVAP